jgi:hypothetical protein
VVAGLVALSGIVVMAQLLGAVGAYTREGVTGLSLTLAALAHWRWRRLAEWSRVQALLESARRLTGGTRIAATTVLGLTGLGIAGWRALDRPPLGWDSLTYHLPIAAEFVQRARLEAPTGPLAMDHYAHFPHNGEILLSWWLLPFHGDVVVGLATLSLMVFGWWAAYALARELSASQEDAMLAATAIAMAPCVYSYATSQNADALVFGSLIAAVLFAVRTAIDVVRQRARGLSCSRRGDRREVHGLADRGRRARRRAARPRTSGLP